MQAVVASSLTAPGAMDAAEALPPLPPGWREEAVTMLFEFLEDAGLASTLDALEKLPVGKKHRPVTEVTIDRVTVHANPFAERDIVIRSPAGAVD